MDNFEAGAGATVAGLVDEGAMDDMVNCVLVRCKIWYVFDNRYATTTSAS